MRVLVLFRSFEVGAFPLSRFRFVSPSDETRCKGSKKSVIRLSDGLLGKAKSAIYRLNRSFQRRKYVVEHVFLCCAFPLYAVTLHRKIVQLRQFVSYDGAWADVLSEYDAGKRAFVCHSAGDDVQ